MPKNFAKYCFICKKQYSLKQMRDEHITFHCVPSIGDERRKRWIESCRVHFGEEVRARVCSKHFSKESFRNYTGPGTDCKRRNLIPAAVPMPASSTEDQLDFCPLILHSFQCKLKEFYAIVEDCKKMEEELTKAFRDEEIFKDACIYLLIDCSITCDLPSRAKYMDPVQVWKVFLTSIFYVEQGILSQRITHLVAAANKNSVECENIKRIRSIWEKGSGVHCLQGFQTISVDDARSRETAIINVLSPMYLTNSVSDNFYGPAQDWDVLEKAKLGLALLYKLMKLFLLNGENPLFEKNF